MATVRGGVPRNRTVGTTEIKPKVETGVAVEVAAEEMKEDPAASAEAEVTDGTKLVERA